MASSGRKYIGLLIGVIIVLLLIIGYTGESRERITAPEEVLLYLIVPVQDAINSAGESVQSFFSAIAYHREIKEENERLREEAARLQQKSIELEEVKQENTRLREMLDFQQRQEMELQAARVVSRDPTGWFDSLTINRGHRHGVEAEMAVITPRGVVGMVSSVSANSSKVLLITNPRLRISAVSQESRDPVLGIVEGRTDDAEQLRIKMDHIPPDAVIGPGNVIVTSHMGSIFPPGVYVGEVRDVDVDMFGLVKYATVEPSVNFNRLEEVFVVTSYEDIDEEEIEEDGTIEESPDEENLDQER